MWQPPPEPASPSVQRGIDELESAFFRNDGFESYRRAIAGRPRAQRLPLENLQMGVVTLSMQGADGLVDHNGLTPEKMQLRMRATWRSPMMQERLRWILKGGEMVPRETLVWEWNDCVRQTLERERRIRQGDINPMKYSSSDARGRGLLCGRREPGAHHHHGDAGEARRGEPRARAVVRAHLPCGEAGCRHNHRGGQGGHGRLPLSVQLRRP